MNNYLQLLIPLLSFALSLISQIVLCRYFTYKLLKSIVIGTFLGSIICITLELLASTCMKSSIVGSIFYLFLNFTIYLSLSYGYFHFLNLGETARRIRLLREISESENGLTLDEILKRYNSLEIVNKRLERLLSKSQILFRNNRYFINKKLMLTISKFIILLKFIILGKKSEFE